MNAGAAQLVDGLAVRVAEHVGIVGTAGTYQRIAGRDRLQQRCAGGVAAAVVTDLQDVCGQLRFEHRVEVLFRFGLRVALKIIENAP